MMLVSKSCCTTRVDKTASNTCCSFFKPPAVPIFITAVITKFSNRIVVAIAAFPLPTPLFITMTFFPLILPFTIAIPDTLYSSLFVNKDVMASISLSIAAIIPIMLFPPFMIFFYKYKTIFHLLGYHQM